MTWNPTSWWRSLSVGSSEAWSHFRHPVIVHTYKKTHDQFLKDVEDGIYREAPPRSPRPLTPAQMASVWEGSTTPRLPRFATEAAMWNLARHKGIEAARVYLAKHRCQHRDWADELNHGCYSESSTARGTVLAQQSAVQATEPTSRMEHLWNECTGCGLRVYPDIKHHCPASSPQTQAYPSGLVSELNRLVNASLETGAGLYAAKDSTSSSPKKKAGTKRRSSSGVRRSGSTNSRRNRK